jgi:aspartate ammonia-lyase
LERDSLGAVRVPAGALYGAHTVRARENFAVSGVTLAHFPGFLAALAEVKIAAARANGDLGVLAPDLAAAIIAGAREIVTGQWHEHFPIDVIQGGGGTATNMNMNEVLANRAAELLGGERGAYDLVHPNDHVNRSQSTNDVYPTALSIAVIRAGTVALEDVTYLQQALAAKAHAYAGVQRLGRTCLRDALPLTIDEGHMAQVQALARTSSDLTAALAGLQAVPLGATAIGTGLGAPSGYRELAVRYLRDQTGLPLIASADPFDALAHLDPYLGVMAALTRVALVMAKIAADLRLLSSGPIGGLGEVRLPAVQVGSSIMPGKVNPSIPELVLQVHYEIRGAAAAVELAAAAGELELNVMAPIVTRHLLSSLADAGRVARIFADRCIAGLEWQVDVLAAHLEGSLAAAVELAAREGYEAGARRDE